MDQEMIKKIEEIKEELMDLNKYIYDNPELGLEEYKSSKAHVDFLKSKGFQVVEKFLGVDTAFKGTYDSKKEGPKVAILVEYDALPGMGHGCGHNLLGVTSVGAATILKDYVDEIGGSIHVFGSPAEENFGLKVEMASEGAFDQMDFALIAHPGKEHKMSGTTSELVPLRFIYKGKTSHAAGSPEKGINALDGVLLLFNSVNALREHLKDSTRIHGVISEGGKAANIVPDLAIADFYIRTPVLGYMEEVRAKVVKCAEAAAMASGASLEIEVYEKIYKGMVTNESLSKVYRESLEELGVENIEEGEISFGSSDMGDISQVCPSIHPYFKMFSDESINAHSVEFASASITEEAYSGMVDTIYTLVRTAIKVMENEELLDEIKSEHKEKFKK